MITHEHATKAGIASGLARQTPELKWQKFEAIRLHTELDYGLAAISRVIGRPRNIARRFLIQAGIYKTGHRKSTHSYGEPCKPWKYKARPVATESTAKHQRFAWLSEWAHVKSWDEAAHWWQHKERKAHYWRRIANAGYSRHRLDPTARAVRSLRHRVWQVVTNANVRKADRSMRLVGCSRDDLINHIARQFKDGMSWDNYGSMWEIDHIRPCASFDMSDPQQQRNCFHFTNLQPLPVSVNRRKWAHHPAPR